MYGVAFPLIVLSCCCIAVQLWVQGPELSEEQREQEAQWGPPRGDPTNWASCLRIVDPSTLETASVIELDNNEAAISMCCMRFSAAEGHMLAVGTVQGLGFLPRTADGAHCPSLPHAANHGLCCAVLCCAVLCCAVLAFKAGIQGWHDVQQLVVTFECSAGSFSESAASMIISSTSLVSRKYYS